MIYGDSSLLRAFLSLTSRPLADSSGRAFMVCQPSYLDAMSATTTIRSLLNVCLLFLPLVHLYCRIALFRLFCSYGYSVSCRAVCFIMCVQFEFERVVQHHLPSVCLSLSVCLSDLPVASFSLFYDSHLPACIVMFFPVQDVAK